MVATAWCAGAATRGAGGGSFSAREIVEPIRTTGIDAILCCREEPNDGYIAPGGKCCGQPGKGHASRQCCESLWQEVFAASQRGYKA